MKLILILQTIKAVVSEKTNYIIQTRHFLLHSFLIQIGVLEGSHEQVYDCSSPDETDSEALDDYDNIDDIPDDLKQ